MTTAHLDATVLICTYNRADLLSETLDSIAAMEVSPALRWEVLVVDNNSRDNTADVVGSRMARFPVPLRYAFDGRQGKSNALNTGIAATDAETIAFTDDDVLVARKWLEAACAPLLRKEAAYTGGPVRPIWEAPRPRWLDATRGDLWGTIAILDHGDAPFVFEERRRIPLGANMAARRDMLERVGGFHPHLGRTGKSLLGQEQAEFFCRSRACGLHGTYVPAMEVWHHVPARRLTRDYFRRWWFWKGISRARLEHLHRITELGVDLSTVARIAGVPRFMFGTAARDAAAWLRNWRDPAARFRAEMRLTYFAGYAWARLREPLEIAEAGAPRMAASGT
jgi:glycosyltransferase involved in cell wall biosynthesis